MNNSAFLSDSLQKNVPYKFEIKENFISDSEIPRANDNFNVKMYDNKKNSKYIVKSATTRKWSIKFKQ